METEVKILSDDTELARTAASLFSETATGAVNEKNLFTVALSGGSTPKQLYSLLASEEPWRSGLPWSRMHFFWSDERHVPPDHPDSNYGMVEAALFSRVAIPPANIHRIQGEESDPARAAEEYENDLKAFFQDQLPRFDLVLLGLGSDGHTASLFPGSNGLREHERLVIANWIEEMDTWRLTLTFPVFNNSARIIFLVSGQEKAEIVSEVLEGPRAKYPAQNVTPADGKLNWLIDREAAARLTTFKA